MAFFCTVSGEQIVAPGLSKSVDPVNGHDLVLPEGAPAPKAKQAERSTAAPASIAPKAEGKKDDAPKGAPKN